MDHSPEFLTEKEDRALKRMERLSELRSTARWWSWKTWISLIAQLAPPGYFFFASVLDPVVSQRAIVNLIVSAVWIGVVVVINYVAPLKRRTDILAQLLEEEIKRPR